MSSAFTPPEVYGRRTCGVPMNQQGAAALIESGEHLGIKSGDKEDRLLTLDTMLTTYSLRVWVASVGEACPVCRQPRKGHEKCAACGILTGPGHTPARDGFCDGCREQRSSPNPDGATQVRLAVARNVGWE